ncbi:MAG: NTP transferase domain-containing protein [Phycisphaerae bacterium]|nr:NTP transferase domain-containing protein [Phycisphaerae bacterium]
MRTVAVIMAGGSGTRLWPLSRIARPKQLLHIVGGQSLLRSAYDRLSTFLPADDIYIVALSSHLPAIADEVSALPPENLIGEPIGRDTANAIALTASILHERDSDTVMGVFTADHFIRPANVFAEDVRTAFDAVAAHPDALLTIGLRPTEPHTGFGYIERGQPVAERIYRVKQFREKPDLETARSYARSGRHYWNSGMFVWRTETILAEFARRLPETHSAVRTLGRSWYEYDGPRAAAEVYPTLTRISIDFAVMEHAKNVLVVEGRFEWHDVGNWTALEHVFSSDEAHNVRAAANTELMDSRNTIVVAEGEHLIAAIGVSDLIVVHSHNATLVCRRDRIQDIRELVARLEREHDGRFT